MTPSASYLAATKTPSSVTSEFKYGKRLPKAMKLVALGRLKPDVGEVRANPRARSATLRVAERTEVAS